MSKLKKYFIANNLLFMFLSQKGEIPMKKNAIHFDKSYYMHCIIAFIITFGVGYLPPVGNLTPLGMKGIGIFFGVLYGWAKVDMLWPSLLGIFAVGTSGYMTMTESFSCAFGDSLTLQMLFILIFVAYIEICGCSKYIAQWFITRKCAIGRPWVLSLLILTVGFVLSMFTMGTSAILITWTIYYEVCASFGMTREDTWTRLMLFGITFSGLAGAVCLPYQVMSVIFIGSTEHTLGIEINALAWSAFRIFTSYGLVLLYWALCRYIVRPDISKLVDAGDVFVSLRKQRITQDQKIGMIVFCVFLLLLVLPSNLPKSIPIISTLKSLGLLGTVTLLIIFLSIIRVYRDGKARAIMDFNQLARSISWTTVILLGGVAPMSTLLESNDAGLFNSILSVLEPLANNLGSLPFTITLTLLLSLMTQISHNIVLIRLAIPLIMPLTTSLGMEPMQLLSIIVLPAQMAFCTPGASANAALVWSNMEWITRASLIRLCVSCFILLMLYNTFVVTPLAGLVF